MSAKEDDGGGGMIVVGGCESISISLCLKKVPGIDVEKIGGEVTGVSNRHHVGQSEMKVSLVDGVLEGALGALEALEIEALVDVMDVDNG
ncbi:hypothetical protein Tco_0144444 [Tanacetum coccineum]